MEKENLIILDMVECGMISVSEAVYLLEVLNADAHTGHFVFSPDEPLTIEICLN